jgi:CheY-like chemotaxis protein
MDVRPEILVVEDNAGDVALLVEAFAESNVPVRLERAMTGSEALERLGLGSAPAPAVFPDLVLLDLNLPRIGGKKVLAAIKDSERLREVLTMVISATLRSEDQDECLALGADACVVKPSTFSGYGPLIEQMLGLLAARCDDER